MNDVARHYVCSVLLDGRALYFLWRAGDDDSDEVVVDQDGNIPAYESEDRARGEAAATGRAVAGAGEVFNLDAVLGWSSSSASGAVDCHLLLDAWNLFGDVRGMREDSPFGSLNRDADGLYEKLFLGCNLPAATPQGPPDTPAWTPKEIEDLRRLLVVGLAEFVRRVRR